MADKNDKSKSASGAGDDDSVSDIDNQETDDGNDSGGDDADDKVSRSAYNKTVTEAKKAREKARKLAEEKAALEEKLLAAEGNKDEKIKSLAQQLADSKKAQKNLFGATVKKALSSQVKSEAAKAGSIDSDAVMKLLDLSDVEVDSDTLEADSDLLASKIADLKKEKPYLFSKAGPKINGKMPSGKGAAEEEKEDLSKLSAAQIRDRLRAMDKQAK